MVRTPLRRFFAGIVTIDRKSTRLNSSHHDISYAVFCLIKNALYQRDRKGDYEVLADLRVGHERLCLTARVVPSFWCPHCSLTISSAVLACFFSKSARPPTTPTFPDPASFPF